MSRSCTLQDNNSPPHHRENASWATFFSYVDHASATTLRLPYFVWLAPCRAGRNELKRVRLQGVLGTWREPRLGWKGKCFRLNVSKAVSPISGPDMSDGR